MTCNDDDIIARATGIVARAKLTVLEAEALALLRDRPGLAMTPLWPPSRVILIVVLNGAHIGRVRLEDTRYEPERWIVVPLAPARPHGPYRSSLAAAESLVHNPSRRERIEGS
jgi:hypothetical protein